MRIGVLGVNSKLADLQLRERLAQACQKLFSAETSHAPHHIVLLSTCNRTELYFSSETLSETHIYILNLLRQEIDIEFDQKMYSYFGGDCFLHLCRVVTGLDSAIVGETEIQGQVKIAYELALQSMKLPKELHYLFQKVLMIGKKTRSMLPAQRDLVGLEHAVFNAGKEYFGGIDEVKILFVGASEVNSKVISFLRAKKIQTMALCNRSQHAAKPLLENQHMQWVEWNDTARWHEFDWIIFGTKATNYLFTEKTLRKEASDKKLLIDLSVPRNVDPRVSLDPRYFLINIDQLNNSLVERRCQMESFVWEAEQLTSKAAQQHTSRFAQKKVSYLNFSGTG